MKGLEAGIDDEGHRNFIRQRCHESINPSLPISPRDRLEIDTRDAQPSQRLIG